MSPASRSTFVQFGIRLPEHAYNELRKLADREGRSMNSELNRMLRVHLDADKQRRQGQ